MNEIVKQSHTRSLQYGIDPGLMSPRRILSGKELHELLEKKVSLINESLPFIRHLYEILKGSGFVIILTDEKGCILEITGDSDTILDARELNMIPGAYMAEDSVGTNAMGVAIEEDRPIQITAQEHFINAYHRWTCSSAPIHNPENAIVGVLNLTGKSHLVHPHTLGLVVAAVKSIEQQLNNIQLNKELRESSSYLDAVINNLSFSTFTVNPQGIIERINDTACKSFLIKRDTLCGNHIADYLPRWAEIWNVMKRGDKILDEEVSLKINDEASSYVMNAMPILSKHSEILGAVITFRDMKRVYNMVNKYTGMQAHYVFDDIIAESDAMKGLISYARQIADSPSTVLITGESGTGKEVFAQSIHNASSRRDAGFVAVNCGAIPENLFESELFGYDDGAFTGARKGGKPGKFELANGGTLFLDEVGEIPKEMQVKLLRAIQEGVITRVGGNKTIPVDVRIIAATNRDLKERVESKKFRLDFYYRLNVIPLRIPSLHERPKDIPLLVNFFLKQKAKKLHRNIPVLNQEILDLLLRYEWPGNVRELENFIEKTVNLDGRILFDVDNKDEFVEKYFPEKSNKTSLPETEQIPSIKPEGLKPLHQVEMEYILQALECCKNNKSHAAKALKISRNTLYLKCKELGIEV